MLIICNPIAGNGQGGKIFSKVCKLLRKNRISWDFKETRYEGEAEEISRKAVNEKKHKRILVIGGDGTINEVIQPLVKTDIDLGIIPAGTGMILHLELVLIIPQLLFYKQQE
ncbi:MAG: diacylglycerol/lipid kinase family protein [Minisyncoccales bacterium]